jgi:MFS family permease
MNELPFLSFLLARVCLSLASTILSVTVGWHLYQATGNPFDLALVGLMQILPIAGLFIITGWVVDNFSRKLILLLCAALQVVVFLGMAWSMNDGAIDKMPIFSLLFLNGCARAFFGPALQAVLPNIVPSGKLSQAVALTSTAWTTAMTAGPFVAGLLIAWIDFQTYWLMAGLALLVLLFLVPLPSLQVTKSSGRGVRQLLEGIRYVRSNPFVLPSISLDMLIVLMGSVVALLPVYAIDVLGVGPEALGLLRAMPALGAVMMGALLSRLPPQGQSGRLLFLALGVFTLSIVVFGLSEQLWLSLAALWVYGASDMVSVNIRSTLIQLATPDALRGRVSAVNSLFIATSNDLGDFRAGSVAAAIGPVATVMSGALMAMMVTVGGCYLFPKLRRLDRLTDVEVRTGNEMGLATPGLPPEAPA